MRKSPSPLLRSTQRVVVSAAAVFGVTALGAIPAVNPAVAFAQPSQFLQEEEAEDNSRDTATRELPQLVSGGYSGFRSADGFGFRSAEDSCEVGGIRPDYYMWVSTGAGRDNADRTVLGRGWIAKLEIDPDFKSGRIVSKTRSRHGFGDIAVGPDSKNVYGVITFYRHNKPTSSELFQYSPGKSSRHRVLITEDGNSDKSFFGFNSLSMGPSGELLFGSGASDDGKSVPVYSVDPSAGSPRNPLKAHKLGVEYPRLDGVPLVSAGDFIVLPDGSLVGFANKFNMDDPQSSAYNTSYVVRWKPDSAGNYSSDGFVMGKLNSPIWAAARVGDHILAALGASSPRDKLQKENQLEILDIDISAGVEEDGENNVLPTTSLFIPGFAYFAYGAAGSGDSGINFNEGRLITKVKFEPDVDNVFPSGRILENDQATIWSTDPCGAKLMPPVVTSGNTSGLQDDVWYVEPASVGSEHVLHQELLRDKRYEGVAAFYETTVSCESKSGNSVKVHDVDLSGDGTTAKVDVSTEPGDTTTCTFVNTPITHPGSLPMTGARFHVWQLIAALLVLAGFGVYPWLRRR